MQEEPSLRTEKGTTETQQLQIEEQQFSNSLLNNAKPIVGEFNDSSSGVSTAGGSSMKKEDNGDERNTDSYSAKISEDRERNDNESDEDTENVNSSKNPKSCPLPSRKEETKKPQALSFIHKLYLMLEKPELDNLIWWHENNSNFLISPNEEFSKTLSNYFKHANIASFIRQLNMYGFHKVNDSTHSASTDDAISHSQTQTQNAQSQNLDSQDRPSLENSKTKSKGVSNNFPVWEFKHSSGVFRKGNIEALNTIKRRSFKNPVSDKEVHNLKLTYDLPPNITVQSESNNYPHHVVNNLHIQQPQHHHHHHQHQHQPHHPSLQPMLSQQNLEFQPQSQAQSSPQSQRQPQQQPSVLMHRNSLMNQAEHEFTDDRGNLLMNSQFQPINLSEQERNGLIANIRDLQQSNTELQVRLDTLTQKTDEVMKLNDFFREELSSINYDFVSTLDLLKEQIQYLPSKSPSQSPSQSLTQSRSHSQDGVELQAQSQSQSRILSAVENIRSKVLERIAYRDVNLKNIAYRYSMSDLHTQFGSHGPHQSFSMVQPPLHVIQTPYSSANSAVMLPRTQPSVRRSGSQPTLHSQDSPHTVSASQHPLHQMRHLSTPSPGVVNLPQYNIAMTSLPQESAPRHSSTTSLTSNPYYNTGYSQIPAVYNYIPDYTQQQIQHQQQLLSQSTNKSRGGNVKSNSSSATKVPTSGSHSNPHSSPFIQQVGPTSNPQPFHSQKASSGINNNEESSFLHKDIRYSLSLSSERSRNASIYDPLQPLPLVPPYPMQIMPGNQSNVNGSNSSTGPVQFYQNGQGLGAYPVVDPNAISRQYSLTQMYSPVDPQSSLNASGKKNERDEVSNNSDNVSAKLTPSGGVVEGKLQNSGVNFSETSSNVSPKKFAESSGSFDAKISGRQSGDSGDNVTSELTTGDPKNKNLGSTKSPTVDLSKSQSGATVNWKSGENNGDDALESTNSHGGARSMNGKNFEIEGNSRRPAVHHILNHGHGKDVNGYGGIQEASECNNKVNETEEYAKEDKHRTNNSNDNEEEREVKRMKI